MSSFVAHSGASLRVVIHYKGFERCKTIYKDSVTVGRGHSQGKPDLDLAPDINVSRQHARLWMDGPDCFIEDLGSRFGTRVDGTPLPAGGKIRLNETSTVQMGDSELTIQVFAQATELPANSDTSLDAAIEIGACLDAAASAVDGIISSEPVLELPVQSPASIRFDALAQSIVTAAVQCCEEASRGALLLQKSDSKTLVVSAFISDDEPAVSETLARRAISSQQAFIWRRNFDGDLALSVRRHRIESGMYAPLIRNGRALGALCVDNPHTNSAFDGEDLRHLLKVANEAAITVASHQFLLSFTCQSVRVVRA